MPVEALIIESQTESGGYAMVGSARPECRLTEYNNTWILVDLEEPSDYDDNDSNNLEDLKNEVFYDGSG